MAFIKKKMPRQFLNLVENGSLLQSTIEPVELIEVQYRSYLGEDDIERFEDIFGRE